MPEVFAAAGADFEAFYLRHYKAIYRVCYAFLKQAEDVEDCTEDVFVRAMQANPSLENERHERAWLTITAMNLCKDRLKHWWRQKVVPLDESMENLAGSSDPGHAVLDAVMTLPVKYKEVMWLYYYEGYQTDEIAALLHRPASTVRNQLWDARGKLKELLGGEPVERKGYSCSAGGHRAAGQCAGADVPQYPPQGCQS